MATYPGEVFPLHVGDTWRPAPEGGRPEELPRGIPGMNRYTDVHGLPELRDAIAGRTSARTGARVGRENVLVTGGATAGLMAAVGALVSPGEEVLLLAPPVTRMFSRPTRVPVRAVVRPAIASRNSGRPWTSV